MNNNQKYTELINLIISVIQKQQSIDTIINNYNLHRDYINDLITLFHKTGELKVKSILFNKVKIAYLFYSILNYMLFFIPFKKKNHFIIFLNKHLPLPYIIKQYPVDWSINNILKSIIMVLQGKKDISSFSNEYYISISFANYLVNEYCFSGRNILFNNLIIDNDIQNNLFNYRYFVGKLFKLFLDKIWNIINLIFSKQYLTLKIIILFVNIIITYLLYNYSYVLLDITNYIFSSISYEHRMLKQELSASFEKNNIVECLEIINKLKKYNCDYDELYYMEARCHKKLSGINFKGRTRILDVNYLDTIKSPFTEYSALYHLKQSMILYQKVYKDYYDSYISDDALGMLAGLKYRSGEFLDAIKYYTILYKDYNHSNQDKMNIEMDWKAAIYAQLVNNRNYSRDDIDEMYMDIYKYI